MIGRLRLCNDAAIWSNISNDVKKALQLKGETIKELLASLHRKFDSYNQLLRDKALKNLRAVFYTEKVDILKFTENYQRQVNIVNSVDEIFSDRAARAIFIQNFDNFPQYKTLLRQFESECNRNGRVTTLSDLLDYANLTIKAKKSKELNPHDIDSYRFKRIDRYRYNRNNRNLHHKPYDREQSEQRKPQFNDFYQQQKEQQKQPLASIESPEHLFDSDDEPAMVKAMKVLQARSILLTKN